MSRASLPRRLVLAAPVAAAMPAYAQAQGGEYPSRAITVVVGFPPGRPGRPRGAARRLGARARPPPARGRAEPGGRRGRHRLGLRRPRGPRWLHAADGALLAGGDPGVGKALRPAGALYRGPVRADRAGQRRPHHARGSRQCALAIHRRFRARREGAAPRYPLRLLRRLRHAARRHGDVRDRRRHPPAARALPGRRPGASPRCSRATSRRWPRPPAR